MRVSQTFLSRPRLMRFLSLSESAIPLRKTAEQGKPWYVRLVACFTCQCIC